MLVSLTFLKKVIGEKPYLRKKKRKTKISFFRKVRESSIYSKSFLKFKSALGMIAFICLKIKFSIFAFLSIFKLIKLKKLNKVVYNKKLKLNDLINQNYFSNFCFYEFFAL